MGVVRHMHRGLMHRNPAIFAVRRELTTQIPLVACPWARDLEEREIEVQKMGQGPIPPHLWKQR